MNRALAREMVRSLAKPPQTGPTGFDLFRQCDWESTLTWLYKSGLTFHVLRRIENEDVVPATIKTRLQADLASNRLRMDDMFCEFQAINDGFRLAGLHFAVQKGFSLFPDYCLEPAMRHQTDFDYLIAPQCLDDARRILRARGYTAEIRTGTEHVLQTPLRAEPPEHNFFILQPSRSVELHLHLWQGSTGDIHLPAPTGVLESVVNRTLYGHSFPALAPEDIFLGQAIHALRHIFYFWVRLSWLFEMAYFLRQRRDDAPFWNRVGARAQWDPRMAEVIGTILALVKRIFGVCAPPALASWTVDALPLAPKLWVERYGREFALSPAPGSKLSLLLEEYFNHSAPNWKESRNARLFPVHRPKPLTAEPPLLPAPTAPRAARGHRWNSWARMLFHLRELLRYGIALPRWRWALRHENTRQKRRKEVIAESAA